MKSECIYVSKPYFHDTWTILVQNTDPCWEREHQSNILKSMFRQNIHSPQHYKANHTTLLGNINQTKLCLIYCIVSFHLLYNNNAVFKLVTTTNFTLITITVKQFYCYFTIFWREHDTNIQYIWALLSVLLNLATMFG